MISTFNHDANVNVFLERKRFHDCQMFFFFKKKKKGKICTYHKVVQIKMLANSMISNTAVNKKKKSTQLFPY